MFQAGVSGRRGLSLIEILAVLGIIAVLAALLYPVLAQSRESARRSACLSNLRQLGSAFSLYLQDADGVLPQQVLLPPLGTNLTCWDVQLDPFMKNREILRCPSDHLSRGLDIPDVGKKLIRSYGMAANLSGLALASAPAPAITVLLAERSSMGTQDAPRATVWPWESVLVKLGKLTLNPIGGDYVPPDFRHTGWGNYLYLDGHVRAHQGPNPTFPGYRTDPDGVTLCGFGAPLPR